MQLTRQQRRQAKRNNEKKRIFADKIYDTVIANDNLFKTMLYEITDYKEFNYVFDELADEIKKRDAERPRIEYVVIFNADYDEISDFRIQKKTDETQSQIAGVIVIIRLLPPIETEWTENDYGIATCLAVFEHYQKHYHKMLKRLKAKQSK